MTVQFHDPCFRDEEQQIDRLLAAYPLDERHRRQASRQAGDWVRRLREDDSATLLDKLFAEYGLNNAEGIALMCLAEALLRIPDKPTLDELIADKISGGHWQRHIGASESFFINSSTWGLLLGGKILQQKLTSHHDHHTHHSAILSKLLLHLGEPLIREITVKAVKLLAHKFVYAETIAQALKNAAGHPQRYSFDMLGEAALTAEQAQLYFERYYQALQAIADTASGDSPRHNHGISIKLSALHPRLEYLKTASIKADLRHKLNALLTLAMQGNVALTIDAEDFTRLALIRETLADLLHQPHLRTWQGFGSVIQAYGKWAEAEIDWYQQLAQTLNMTFSLRLVKGAYWDSEIKQAQRDNFPDYPVYTQKYNSDLSYLCCAVKLRQLQQFIYPQFATHNAHTLAYVSTLFADGGRYEVQRLFGMGQALHDLVQQQNITSRVYAPIGEHHDLLSYLVRRLLENGANQSFVSQLMNRDCSVEDIVQDPGERRRQHPRPALIKPDRIYGAARRNSAGWVLCREDSLTALRTQLEALQHKQWQATSLLVDTAPDSPRIAVKNPANYADQVGAYQELPVSSVAAAVQAAQPWQVSAAARRQILFQAAALMEARRVELYSILQRESGKVIADAIAEVREAIDFLRYYATQCQAAAGGIVCCISPWNFPLAIFSGQIAAALAAGNAILAKPAEHSNLIAHYTVSLFYEAGVPPPALQLLLGDGTTVGAALCRQPEITAAAFTGSLATAAQINQSMAAHGAPDYTLVAETGGINAMIIDSTALPNQAVEDIITSAFRSAGQRCSALRMLYVQEEVYEEYCTLLTGRMQTLAVDDPCRLETDIGPLISASARQEIADYVARRHTRILAPERASAAAIEQLNGNYFPPTLIAVNGIDELTQEVFGPVLHIAPFRAEQLMQVIKAINISGYGLTFAMHSRIDARLARVAEQMQAGNLYFNRDQIGAVVESQPFGGCGLSGTGPKAGGPNYLKAFARYPAASPAESESDMSTEFSAAALQAQINAAFVQRGKQRARQQPGITGEENLYSVSGRGIALCLGPGAERIAAQTRLCEQNGCVAVSVADGFPLPLLETLKGIDVVLYDAGGEALRRARQYLSRRSGAIIPLVWHSGQTYLLQREQHLCINTTSAGGDVKLLAE